MKTKIRSLIALVLLSGPSLTILFALPDTKPNGNPQTRPSTPNVSVQMQRGASSRGRESVFLNPNGGIDDPLVPKADSEILVSQPSVSKGVVADGVTPLLFKLVQSEPAQASYDVTVEHLSGGIHILNDGVWSDSPTLTFDGTNTTAFAYIDGMTPAVFRNGEKELSATLTLTNTQDPSDLITKVFYVRRPPIFVVHGYNSDSKTWGRDFLRQLATATVYDPGTPNDSFIRLINYGVANDLNTYGSFAALVPELDRVLSIEEGTLHNGWAFTRYDVVAHSQGGILTRLLCGQNETDLTRKFKEEANFNRGRFRRVITIGSPHNGSTLAYYVSHLNTGVIAVIPASLKEKFLQPKFDPFGNQIHAINDASANADPDANFCLIATTINGGAVTLLGPLVYSMISLTEPSPHDPLHTRGEVVLRNGSDGVVDIQSQKARQGTRTSEIVGVDICHAPLPPPGTVGDIATFVAFGTTRSDTNDARQVASVAARLLTGSADNFGAFLSPDNLSPGRQAEIDAEIPSSSTRDLIRGTFHRPAALPGGPSSYTFTFTPDPSEPLLDGTADWFAEVFSPEGVTTAGLTVTPDPSDSTHVTVDVDASVRGEVTLYLSYDSTNGHLIFSEPFLVVSIPPGANLTGIELDPNQITAMIGDVIGLEIWGMYDNGSRSQLFVQPENSTFSSSNPNVASVDSGTGQLRAVGAGDATITATYAGLTNETAIHVARAPRSLPSPRPRPTPRLRP